MGVFLESPCGPVCGLADSNDQTFSLEDGLQAYRAAHTAAVSENQHTQYDRPALSYERHASIPYWQQYSSPAVCFVVDGRNVGICQVSRTLP